VYPLEGRFWESYPEFDIGTMILNTFVAEGDLTLDEEEEPARYIIEISFLYFTQV
jgi:hypothetical protein